MKITIEGKLEVLQKKQFDKILGAIIKFNKKMMKIGVGGFIVTKNSEKIMEWLKDAD